MEGQPSSALAVVDNSARVEIDTSRPFRSVKEAVAIFGERFLLGAADVTYRARSLDQSAGGRKPSYSLPAPPSKPGGGLRSASSSPPSFSSALQTFVRHGDDDLVLLNSLKKLELDLEDTKRELTQLKEKESETELTVASLSAQLQESMSVLAEIKWSKRADSASPADINEQHYITVGKIRSDRWRDERIRELAYLPTLAQALSIGDMEDGYGAPKRKPIIPLIGDIFSCIKNKDSSTDQQVFLRGTAVNLQHDTLIPSHRCT